MRWVLMSFFMMMLFSQSSMLLAQDEVQHTTEREAVADKPSPPADEDLFARLRVIHEAFLRLPAL